ncbi:type II toxin-antitoxin system VapC family toxin [Sinimarinibacterium sp. CAU 1509]|uniref:PIN domain-containing protein n=1 Tax=Sinimarinibacterium sp. CAU 1509 TaxID=2562283 RepID=UPI0010ABF181|nr:PIN domain-containing protein [Sinimarinibacterium sp. CAU 1509]TJY62209.1 type II toxin-antitoxin system VapC family toxin [Sinimarinibacterium sp. CAU 1509]
MKYLLDSDVLAAAVKGRLPVVLRLAELKPTAVAVSVMARVEAETALRLQPRAQARYGKLLKEFLSSVAVLDFGASEAQQAVGLSAYLQSAGESLPLLDLQQAATALAHQLTLVTDRVATFASVPNLDVEWWA